MAFWLYSSGSTGKPKGVVHLHHDIEVTCETYARQVLGMREDDVTSRRPSCSTPTGWATRSRSRCGSAPRRC
jgi:acyl-coenzyme A synthetase/AMP-(fatty) acid ligase